MSSNEYDVHLNNRKPDLTNAKRFLYFALFNDLILIPIISLIICIISFSCVGFEDLCTCSNSSHYCICSNDTLVSDTNWNDSNSEIDDYGNYWLPMLWASVVMMTDVCFFVAIILCTFIQCLIADRDSDNTTQVIVSGITLYGHRSKKKVYAVLVVYRLIALILVIVGLALGDDLFNVTCECNGDSAVYYNDIYYQVHSFPIYLWIYVVFMCLFLFSKRILRCLLPPKEMLTNLSIDVKQQFVIFWIQVD